LDNSRCPILTYFLPYFSRSTKTSWPWKPPSWSYRIGSSSGAEVAENVRGALDTIDKNEEFIKLTLAVLMTPE